MKKNPFLSYTIIFTVYFFAILAGYYALNILTISNIYKEMLIVDITVTIFVFIFSYFFRNSSVYDPYWSVIPVPIAVYWISIHPDGIFVRQLLVLGVIIIWSLRLTINWIKTFPDLTHEDWRYKKLAEDTGSWYWPVSLVGIHLFPTVIVFAGMLPVVPAVSTTDPLSLFDLAGVIICLTAILIEHISDEQLRKFKKTNTGKNVNMERGLWSFSRHPNYFGEILFWFGLFIISLSAGIKESYWTALGFLSMLFLFYFISVPMMEKRLLKTKKNYSQYRNRVPSLIPFLR